MINRPMDQSSIINRLRGVIASDRLFEDRLDELRDAPDPLPFLNELIEAYRAELTDAREERAEDLGVIKAPRRQRDEAEAAVRRVREKAAEWAALAPADDWGENPGDTVLADAGRYLLAVIDQPERTTVDNLLTGTNTADNPERQR